MISPFCTLDAGWDSKVGWVNSYKDSLLTWNSCWTLLRELRTWKSTPRSNTVSIASRMILARSTSPSLKVMQHSPFLRVFLGTKSDCTSCVLHSLGIDMHCPMQLFQYLYEVSAMHEESASREVFNLLQFISPMSAEPGIPAPVHPKWESLLLVRIWHIGAWHSVSARKVVTVTKMLAVVMTSGTEYFKKGDERKYLIWWVRRKDLWRHVSFKGIIPTENDADVCRWAPWGGDQCSCSWQDNGQTFHSVWATQSCSGLNQEVVSSLVFEGMQAKTKSPIHQDFERNDG